jgi:hypothetical protein
MASGSERPFDGSAGAGAPQAFGPRSDPKIYDGCAGCNFKGREVNLSDRTANGKRAKEG